MHAVTQLAGHGPRPLHGISSLSGRDMGRDVVRIGSFPFSSFVYRGKKEGYWSTALTWLLPCLVHAALAPGDSFPTTYCTDQGKGMSPIRGVRDCREKACEGLFPEGGIV
jgi:hypothetical protein